MGNLGLTSLFRDKRVLITGDTGFKGSWLKLLLQEMGAEIRGFALPPDREDALFLRLPWSDRTTHIDGNINDASAVDAAFQDFQPEYLFHLAAQPLVRFSYEQPKLTFDTNVGGSVNILEAVRKTSSLRSVIYVTSDKSYKNREWIWGYRENDELGGHDPYSASKAAAELVFSSYVDSFFSQRPELGIASVRAGNVIGGGDWAQDRIVPESVRSLQAREPIIVRNPNSTRPWQHVLEPLWGYIMLATRLHENPIAFSGSWNFGPGPDSVRTVRELTEGIVAAWGEGMIQIKTPLNAPHEARLLFLNCDKAHQLLHWKPRWNFEATVYETVRWYRDVFHGASVVEIMHQQIHDYLEVGD